MAKTSSINKTLKKEKLLKKYIEKRRLLKSIIKSSTERDEIAEAQAKLAKLPVNSCPARYCTRCNQCGRPRAVYRKFGLCRICLRNHLMTGNVTGGRKSSW